MDSTAAVDDFSSSSSSSSSRVLWLIAIPLILVSLYFGLKNSTSYVYSKNHENINPSIPQLEKKLISNLEKVEAGLIRVRVAIKEAQSKNQTFHDPDYVPTGPIYWNPTAFHRYFIVFITFKDLNFLSIELNGAKILDYFFYYGVMIL